LTLGMSAKLSRSAALFSCRLHRAIVLADLSDGVV
jgi:hypothetical protein